MQIYSHPAAIPLAKYIVSFGNFDGVHLGHLDLFRQINEYAVSTGAKSMLITFCPHPLALLAPAAVPAMITSNREQDRLFAAAGIDLLLRLSFDQKLAAHTATQFLDFLTEHLDIGALFVGPNHFFGKNRSGNTEFLAQNAEKYGYRLFVVSPLAQRQEIVSSSRIRALLNQGQLALANQLLGRNYSVCGAVLHGAMRGRTIGVPTANLAPKEGQLLPPGVYVSQVTYAGKRYRSVTNIGRNPTFELAQAVSVETHILDFDRDIYGEKIRVELCKRLRHEQKFTSVLDLIEQIKQDILQAHQYFSGRHG